MTWKIGICSIFATSVAYVVLRPCIGSPLHLRTLTAARFSASYGLLPLALHRARAPSSQVTGDNGTGSEVAAGVNWYFKQRRGSRVTVDVAKIEDSPAQQNRTGYVAGGSGTLFRVQLWTFF